MFQAVRLESAYPQCTRYMVVVSTIGRQDTEESVVLGMDFTNPDRSVFLTQSPVHHYFPMSALGWIVSLCFIVCVLQQSMYSWSGPTSVEWHSDSLGRRWVREDTPSISSLFILVSDPCTNFDVFLNRGFSVSTANRVHIFKPVSVQAMWWAPPDPHVTLFLPLCHSFYFSLIVSLLDLFGVFFLSFSDLFCASLPFLQVSTAVLTQSMWGSPVP